MNRKKVGVLAVLCIILVAGFLIIGQMPIHRSTVLHTDTLGDVSDPDIDIVEIESYQDGSYIVLEMVVAGEIQTSVDYLYRLTITARGIINSDIHVYSCTFQNGVLTSYAFDILYSNSTLQILFPLTAFVSDSYMIGLEGSAQSSGDEDTTDEDRDGEVSRLLFRLW